MPDTYECAYCHGVFNEVSTQEEREEEFKRLFPDDDINDVDRICDVCFKQFIEPTLVK